MQLSTRYVVGRVAWTVVAAWLFLTVAFLVLSFTPDPNKIMRMYAAMGHGGEQAAEAAAAYEALRGRDAPLLVRYVQWIVGFVTLDFGHSFTYDEPVMAVLAERIPRTLAYLVPAVVVATACSVVAGAVASIRGGLADWFTGAVSYVGISVPILVLAEVLPELAGENGAITYQTLTYDGGPFFVVGNLLAIALPSALLALNLFATQTIWVRNELGDLVDAEFVKTLRANGFRSWAVGRRLVRNAVAPLLSLLVTEVIVVLFVTMYVVEILLGYPGFAMASYRGFQERDFGLVLASIVLLVLTALLATLAKDLLAAVLDPRVAGREEA